jgi:predicted extracellular nuclease
MIRVAAFNVQNLFDRPKIINLEDTAESSRLLKLADRLQRELGKRTYDQEAIGELLASLKGFVEVRVDSGKFYKGRSKTIVQAQSPDDWRGAIDFKRTAFSDRQRANTAGVIQRINADVMGMIEVEGRQALHNFMQEFVPKAQRLDRELLIDSPIDPRGIDVALAWRGAGLSEIRSNVYDTFVTGPRSRRVWSRDCLEVELSLAGGKSLWVLVNHFKSKMGGDPPEAREKRTAQSRRVAEILATRYDLRRDYVIVLGDLNDTPESEPIAPLYGVERLHDVFDVAGVPADERWTYYYHPNRAAERRTQIDYIFVSESLRSRVHQVQVHREGMTAVAQGRIAGVEPAKGITSWQNAASDHAAVSVDLDGLDVGS